MTAQYTYDSKGRPLGVFIPINEWIEITEKYKELGEPTQELPPSKQEIIDSIQEGLRQVKLHGEGKIKLKTAKQLFDEL